MRIGIIGFGNLGRSLASGLVRSGSAGAGDIYVCENSPEACAIAENGPYNAHACGDVNLVINNSDVVFLTVKSHVFEALSAGIIRSGLEGKTIVSCMAGVTFEMIYSLIGEVDLVRLMPSLAISVCDGVIAYTKCPPELVRVLGKLGYAFETEPENIEKVMAFSSSGLGFAAHLIDAFVSAGEQMGFSSEQATRIARITFRNAIERGAFKDTVAAVSTPGGATEQGVRYMNEHNVHSIVAVAVRKAYERMT